MRPRAGVKYARADLNHMRFKFYPSREAAVARLPHRGLRFDLAELQLRVPAGVDAGRLFGGRKDLDIRVPADCLHMARLGVDIAHVKRDCGAKPTA